MRLQRFGNLDKDESYEQEQKQLLNSIISRINRIGDFFDVVVKLEKYMIDEVTVEYQKLVDVRKAKSSIESGEGPQVYIDAHFLPAANALIKKMDTAIANWNIVEKEYTTPKIAGFIKAMEGLHKELEVLDNSLGGNELTKSPMTGIVRDILDSFTKFKMYNAIVTSDHKIKIETLLSMQKNILDSKSSDNKRITLDDL